MRDLDLLRLFQLFDSQFPIGAFAHSGGLETYGQQGAALACYEKLSRGADLAAQTALYEVGNLQRNVGDLAASLSAYRSYVSRFPSGPLWNEAKLSAVEVLTKLARYREALDESASLLASRPGMERADELRLLRGNLYREALGDLRHAADEYELASRGTSHASGEALFLRGTCVEALGDVALAASIYSMYLERGDPSHAADAQQRRSALSRRK